MVSLHYMICMRNLVWTVLMQHNNTLMDFYDQHRCLPYKSYSVLAPLRKFWSADTKEIKGTFERFKLKNLFKIIWKLMEWWRRMKKKTSSIFYHSSFFPKSLLILILSLDLYGNPVRCACICDESAHYVYMVAYAYVCYLSATLAEIHKRK